MSEATAMHATAPTHLADDGTATRVRAVFHEVTRYPLEILEPDADLEEDLGIDSVKLGEILSVLRQAFSLPEDLRVDPADTRTIAGITAALERLTGNDAAERPLPAPAPPAAGEAPFQTRPQAQSVAPQALPLAGKVALVTGSGQGLGKVIALHLAELGAKVAINSFHSRAAGEETVEEINDRGGTAHHCWGSVAKSDHLDRIFATIEERYGTLDFLISNASNGLLARVEDLERKHLELAYRTSVIGFHQAAIRAVAAMKAGGRIVALSSPGAHRCIEYFAAIGTVKAAVESLVRYMAVEFAPLGVRVNCVSPGPVYGELIHKFPESERLIPYWESLTAGERLCEPEDVADMVSFLLGEEADALNGSVVVVDGGSSLHI